MHHFWKILALLAVGVAPALALAQQALPAPVPAPARVDTVRQPVASDAAANQLPRDPAAARAAALAGQAQPMNALAGFGADYRIGPNDLLEIDVYGVTELKRTVRVNSTGHVSLPLVGAVQVAGLTPSDAEALIALQYGSKYLQDPQISIFIREFTTQRITLDGAVVKPGIYPLTGQITLLRALALAGGGSQLADLEQVMLFRITPQGQSLVEKHDVLKIRLGEAPDPLLQSDDVVVVNRDPQRAALRDSVFRDLVDILNPFSASVGNISR